MKKIDKFFLSIGLILIIAASLPAKAQDPGKQWSAEKAWQWYNSNPWICGFNYIPANAINYTAMWDKTSFSPEVIDKELALAEVTGFNSLRAVLQFAVWENDPAWFRSAFAKFLAICTKHKIRVMPALFDDCVFGTNVDPAIGKQPEPLDGWYAWAWSPSPGETMVKDTTTYPRIGKYVKDVIGSFKNDPAILAWDLYNEPSTSALPDKSYQLVRKVFRWAREVNPVQPLTIAYWDGDPVLNKIIFDSSDIISFHCYSDKEATEKLIDRLRVEKRPLICSEWLNRPIGSTVESVLPLFFREKVGCMHWGLVNGKTQTNLPWGHRPEMLPYKGIWQHDLYWGDFKPYSPYEMKVFKSYIDKSNAKADIAPLIDKTVLTKVQEELIGKFGDAIRDRMVRGTTLLAGNWRPEDGTADGFTKFCVENFLPDSLLVPNFVRIQRNLTLQGGYLSKIAFGFNESEAFTDFTEYRADAFFRRSIPSVDPWKEKLAQFVQLNFPQYSLDEKRQFGRDWSREKWAMVKLGDRFASRPDPEFKADMADEVKEFGKYINRYFFRMDHICSPDGTFPFTKPLTLHSHFGLRDNLKEDYTRPNGLARQEITGKLVEHITNGTVPAEFVADTSTRWNPWTNELFRIEKGKKVPVAFNKEGLKRYAGLLAAFRNRSSSDRLYGPGSTVIQRTFENGNLTLDQVEGLIRTFLSDPVLVSVGKLVSKRLGRPLQPFDIWYSGFQSQSQYPANMLDSITRARYPVPKALQDDLPAILVRMGFARDEANYIGAHAMVRPITSGGYSEQPPLRGDTSLMTTVFNASGLDYKGYRISMHELGHVVCGIYSTRDIDHFLLADVPTGGITEGFAEMLAYKNMEGLGLAKGTFDEQKQLLSLASLWYMLDLGGQSLTDIETWKWMYAHPQATAEELKRAVLDISAGIWNKYYSPIFGGIRDQHILAIYNHFITGSLYLFNYFLGNVIMFQVYDAFMPDNLAGGLEKACLEGNTMPELWMKKAVGQGISIDPLLKTVRLAVGLQRR